MGKLAYVAQVEADYGKRFRRGIGKFGQKLEPTGKE